MSSGDSRYANFSPSALLLYQLLENSNTILNIGCVSQKPINSICYKLPCSTILGTYNNASRSHSLERCQPHSLVG